MYRNGSRWDIPKKEIIKVPLRKFKDNAENSPMQWTTVQAEDTEGDTHGAGKSPIRTKIMQKRH